MKKHRELRQLTIDGGHEVVASVDLSPTWGGKRKGAGRPKKIDRTVTISIRLSPVMRSLLQERASCMEMSLSEYLVQVIRDSEFTDEHVKL